MWSNQRLLLAAARGRFLFDVFRQMRDRIAFPAKTGESHQTNWWNVPGLEKLISSDVTSMILDSFFATANYRAIPSFRLPARLRRMASVTASRLIALSDDEPYGWENTGVLNII